MEGEVHLEYRGQLAKQQGRPLRLVQCKKCGLIRSLRDSGYCPNCLDTHYKRVGW